MLKTKEIIWLMGMAILSLTLGILYSIHNTDSHHWGFITGTALDYINGKHFFTEIYVQYGVGETLLFNFIHHFIPINFTTVGILTSVAYTFNLFIIYLNLKKLSNATIAILISFTVFLLNPFTIVPWPDYWAGLSLSLSCYFLLFKTDKNELRNSILAGIFLFFGFMFRNTYGVSFIVASIAYFIFSILNKKLRNKSIGISILIFFALTAFYLLLLIKDHTFELWYGQAIGSASSQYGIGADSIIALLKKIFLPFKFWLPNNQTTTTMSALFYLGLYTLYLLLFKLNDYKERFDPSRQGIVIFLTFLGLAGIFQEILIFEIFRFQNSCSPLYLIFAVLLTMKFPDPSSLIKKRAPQLIIAIYLLLLIAKFPHSASWHPVYEGELNSYSSSNIPIFKWHRFRPDVKKYYDDLVLYLCDGKSKIMNLTFDSTIPYLCPGQENTFKIPFFHLPMIEKINPEKLAAEEHGIFNEDEVIIAEKLPLATNPKINLIEIARMNRPISIRFWPNPIVIYRVKVKN